MKPADLAKRRDRVQRLAEHRPPGLVVTVTPLPMSAEQDRRLLDLLLAILDPRAASKAR